MKKYAPFRGRGFSLLVDKKALLVLTVLLLAVLIVMVVSAGMGQTYISPLEIVKVLFGYGDSGSELVVITLRLPRIVAAVFVGACLAVSGAILQGMVRNPLASPDIIGITGGASVAAVAFLVLFAEETSVHWMPIASFIGAGVTAFVIYFLAWKSGVSSMRLVLIGVGIGAAMTSLTSLVVILSPIYTASQAIVWLTGSIYGTTWQTVLTILPWALVLIPMAFLLAKNLNVQELGDEVATSVGSSVQWQRFLLLGVSVALAGAAVSIGGAIGFVGLMAPHIGRKLVGPSFGGLLPVSALLGSLLVLIADIIGKHAFAPLDIPVGVFTAAIGAPFFIYLLYRYRNE
jgi:iron complex transport system permease protein